MKGYVVIVCVVLWGLAECTDEPHITPCRQPELACLKQSAQDAVPLLAAGVPSMGIEVMDPMHVDQVKTTQAGLKMDFRNTTVTGLKHCHVESLERHGLKTKLILKCSVTMKGDYTLGGQLLVMPIKGEGEYTIKIRGIVVNIQFSLGEVKGEGGDLYWTVKDWQFTSKVEKGAHFQFNNLFNGNKALSDAVHLFANNNWEAIFQEVAPPIIKVIVSKLVAESTKLFDKVPINKLEIQ